MGKIETGKLPFSKIDHVGVIVRDLDKAVEYYQSLGIATFGPEITTDSSTTAIKLYGKPQ